MAQSSSTTTDDVLQAVRSVDKKRYVKFVLLIHVDKDCNYEDETIIQAVRTKRKDKMCFYEVVRDATPMSPTLRCPTCRDALLDGSQCDCTKYD